MEDIEYQEEETPKDFQEAFNSGYILAQYNPKVLEQVLFDLEQKGDKLIEGFIWGKWQYENEKQLEQKMEFKQMRNKGKDREKDFER